MIRFKDKTFEDYFIDPVTAVITDKDGNVQPTYINQGYLMFKNMGVHRIQAHTAYGYKEGYHVHHLDENPLNNSLSNLVYLTSAEHAKLHNTGEGNGHYGKPCSEYVKKRLTESNSGNKNGNFGKHCWTNKVKNIIAEECPEGFVKGYHKSEETRQKMSKALKGIGLGKHLSDEHRQKIREGVLRHNKEKAQ